MENEKNENNSEKEEIIETESTKKPETKTENTKSKKEIKEEKETKTAKSEETENISKKKIQEKTKISTKKKKMKEALTIIIPILLIIFLYIVLDKITTLNQPEPIEDNNYNFDTNTNQNNSNQSDDKTPKDDEILQYFDETITAFEKPLININNELKYASKQNLTKDNSENFYIENNKVYYKNIGEDKIYEFNVENELPKHIIYARSDNGGAYLVLTENGNVYAMNGYSNDNIWKKINYITAEDIITQRASTLVSTSSDSYIFIKSNNKYYLLGTALYLWEKDYPTMTEVNLNNLHIYLNSTIDLSSRLSKYTINCGISDLADENTTFYENHLLKDKLKLNDKEIIINSIFKTTDSTIIIDTNKNVIIANETDTSYKCAKLLEISEIKKNKVKNITITAAHDKYSSDHIKNFTITYNDDTSETYEVDYAYINGKRYN